MAVVGGLLDEHQVVGRGDPGLPPMQPEPPLPRGLHPGRAGVFLTQMVTWDQNIVWTFLSFSLYFFSFWLKTNVKCPHLTDFSEGSQLLPAGDEGAGAREAVTLTSHLHAVNNRLGLGKLIYDIYRTFMWLHQHQHKAGSGIKMIQIKLSLVNLIQRREPATHRWMVKRRFNYNNNVATLCPGNFIVIYPLSLLSSRK